MAKKQVLDFLSFLTFVVSADQEVAAIFGATLDEPERPKLVRQNTFTKESSTENSLVQAATATSFATAAASTTRRSSKVFQNKGEVKLVGGRLVQKHEEQDSVNLRELRASVHKPSDNLALEGSVEYAKQDWASASGKVERRSIQANQSSIELSSGLAIAKSSGGKQRAVRRKTWTKEEGQEIAEAVAAERATMVRHEDNLKLAEGKFESRVVSE